VEKQLKVQVEGRNPLKTFKLRRDSIYKNAVGET
jgi:hypothetical protein